MATKLDKRPSEKKHTRGKLMSMHLRFLFLLALAFTPALPITALSSAGPPQGEAYLSNVRTATRQLARDLELLQDTIASELGEKKERAIYLEADIVLADLESFQNALKPSASREDLYKRFDELDTKLETLISAGRDLGKEQRVVLRAMTYVQASHDQLHFDLSAGDLSEARTRQVVERQVRAFTIAATDVEQAANYALGDIPGRGVLMGSLSKLLKAAEEFRKDLPKQTTQPDLKKDFARVNVAWEGVVLGFKSLPPKQSTHLVRTAVRLDQIHARLYRLLGVEGQRTQLVIRT
jgi:hypothetical protein